MVRVISIRQSQLLAGDGVRPAVLSIPPELLHTSRLPFQDELVDLIESLVEVVCSHSKVLHASSELTDLALGAAVRPLQLHAHRVARAHSRLQLRERVPGRREALLDRHLFGVELPGLLSKHGDFSRHCLHIGERLVLRRRLLRGVLDDHGSAVCHKLWRPNSLPTLNCWHEHHRVTL